MFSKMNCQHVNCQNIYKIVKILEYLCLVLSGPKKLLREHQRLEESCVLVKNVVLGG
jgi:hypothetical protein